MVKITVELSEIDVNILIEALDIACKKGISIKDAAYVIDLAARLKEQFNKE